MMRMRMLIEVEVVAGCGTNIRGSLHKYTYAVGTTYARCINYEVELQQFQIRCLRHGIMGQDGISEK